MMFIVLLISFLIHESFADGDFDGFDLKKTWDFSDYIRNRGEKEGVFLDVAKPFVHKCAFSEGICLQSAACPWGRIMLDQSEGCTRHHKNLVCCHVARVLAPVNLFLAYD